MSRISETFARLHREDRRGLIPFITAGDPDLETTYDLILGLAQAGAAIIELGVPFSDPIADGLSFKELPSGPCFPANTESAWLTF